MDAVQIEHDFAYALGIKVGHRGDVNDADFIRASKVEYLRAAVSKACSALRERLVNLEDEDIGKELEIAIDALDATYTSLQSAGIDKTPICFALWSAAAVTMRLIARTLDHQA